MHETSSSKRQLMIDAHAAVGREGHLGLDLPQLANEMERHDIAAALVRPMGRELVVDNVAGNDQLLDGPESIRALVTVNPWYGAAVACDELKRCRERGAVGLFLHPARQGFFPTDDIAQPLIERAASFHWPVLCHTGTYVYADVLALAEIARRFPDTPFIAGYAGFSDMWFELPEALAQADNLYLDTSMVWGDAILQVVRRFGAERILFAGGVPRNRYPVVLRMLDRLDLSDADRNAILSGNAMRLFDLSEVGAGTQLRGRS